MGFVPTQSVLCLSFLTSKQLVICSNCPNSCTHFNSPKLNVLFYITPTSPLCPSRLAGTLSQWVFTFQFFSGQKMWFANLDALVSYFMLPASIHVQNLSRWTSVAALILIPIGSEFISLVCTIFQLRKTSHSPPIDSPNISTSLHPLPSTVNLLFHNFHIFYSKSEQLTLWLLCCINIPELLRPVLNLMWYQS